MASFHGVRLSLLGECNSFRFLMSYLRELIAFYGIFSASGQRQATYVHALQFKQADFSAYAAPIACEIAARPNDPVARDYDCNGIMAYCTAYCLAGHFSFVQGICHLFGDGTIGCAIAIGNSTENFPDLLLKAASLRSERNGGYVRALSTEIGI